MIRHRGPLVFACLALLSCQSVEQRNGDLIETRRKQLQTLSHWKSQTCTIRADLSEPAKARYDRLFANSKKKRRIDEYLWKYEWRAREVKCEIKPLGKSEAERDFLNILTATVCVLLHVHWVNSPFDELDLSKMPVQDQSDWVQLGPELKGIRIAKKGVRIDTDTPARGRFSAAYEKDGGEWLPKHLEHTSHESRIVIGEMFYDGNKFGGRRPLNRFSLYVGNSETEPWMHSTVYIENCLLDEGS